MRFIGWLFAAVLLILLGWIGGPVAMLSYRVATAINPEGARESVADALLGAYHTMPSDQTVLQSTGPDTTSVRACGYPPYPLLREDGVPFSKTIDWGITVLNFRADRDDERDLRYVRTEAFAKTHSVAIMAALITCRDAPLERFCRARVEQMTVEADRANAKALAELRVIGEATDQRILCTYLDGAAARRGITKTAPAPKPAP